LSGGYRALFELTGRTAIVTGATGILGRRFCAGLAAHGASVVVADVDEGETARFAEELSDAYGTAAIGLACDVSDEAAVARLAARTEESFGPIDVLLNNAASKSTDLERFFAPFEHSSLETWREVSSVNLEAVYLLCREIGPRMVDRGRGSIIQTASIYGVRAPDQRIYEGSEYLGRRISSPAVYSATKAGVVGLTKYLATLWGPHGVRVNAIAPGGVASGQNSAFQEQYSRRVPMGRMAEADEMVGALVFLASDASSYVTGQTLVVDGGLSAW
jgi:NAD(P)-dependent dehydrogenase (short-subunit alcohol dehydrogenase family)